MHTDFDCIIIGAGAAGLSAGLYAARGRVNTLIIERGDIGGQTATTHLVDNYPGSIENPTGPQLMDRMKEQCLQFGAKISQETLEEVYREGQIFKVTTNKGEYLTKTLIIATGAKAQSKQDLKGKKNTGEEESPIVQHVMETSEDLDVAVIGGGDAAVEEAIYLTRFAKKVTIIHRRDQLRAVKSIQEKAFANEKLTLCGQCC